MGESNSAGEKSETDATHEFEARLQRHGLVNKRDALLPLIWLAKLEALAGKALEEGDLHQFRVVLELHERVGRNPIGLLTTAIPPSSGADGASSMRPGVFGPIPSEG